MKVQVEIVNPTQEECIRILCHKVTQDISEIVTYIKKRQGTIHAFLDDRQYELALSDIYYIEAVDNRTFLYCTKQVYETRLKLYELEQLLADKSFARISKSTIVNLMKIKAIKPALNSRFIAILSNQEEIMITRKYVPVLREKMRGDNGS